MKIRAILLTNNEDDILHECVVNAINWADNVYIFDTGSTDNTWNICKTLAANYSQVKLFKSEYREFNWWETANEVFSNFFEEANTGDWWCVHSTDEIYVENPRHILSKVPPQSRTVWSLTLNFYFTEVDLDRFLKSESGAERKPLPRNYSEDLQFYIANYSEPRFFKHYSGITRDIRFSSKKFLPNHRERILLRHLQYRSPQQINRRIESRRKIFYANDKMQFVHEADFCLDENGNFSGSLFRAANYRRSYDLEPNSQDFLRRLIPSEGCDRDLKDGYFKVNYKRIPMIQLSFRSILKELIDQMLLRKKYFADKFRAQLVLRLNKIRKY